MDSLRFSRLTPEQQTAIKHAVARVIEEEVWVFVAISDEWTACIFSDLQMIEFAAGGVEPEADAEFFYDDGRRAYMLGLPTSIDWVKFYATERSGG